MQDIIRKMFLFLVAVFIFSIYSKSNNLIYFFLTINISNDTLHMILSNGINLTLIVMIFYLPYRLDKVMKSMRFSYPIQAIVSLVLIPYFLYLLFFPLSFYTEQTLKDVGVEKIQLVYQLSNNELGDKERAKLALKARPSSSALSYLFLPHLTISERELITIEVIDIKRKSYRYELTVEVEEIIASQNERNTYRYKFEREEWGIKIVGWELLN
jgi:hypothetical protein